MHDYSNLRRVLLEVLVIVTLGVVMGLSANLKLVMQVLRGSPPTIHVSDATVPTGDNTPRPIDLASLRRGIENSSLLLIDARISELYAAGHLPGAISLPLDEIESRLSAFQQRIPGDRSLAIYCNGYGCPDSFDLAVKLLAAGYRDVQVYEGGFPEWRDAGLPVVTEKTP
ncbi:rhodanese-like domain-containing protein [Geothermobacter hydrogeniphilus]|uniref:Sulfurtransferase n=1 Tax=Geothermobacter hydrogeniphilus TaxID=1969733 RepID=A0A1X0Y469_9BACT|nr:rhodanese-like domain-containing protein [Geothermobacter hydrogeniphilus]ORJ59852.1 hypothetical protein B5V00_09260 [Geothermobacter hydrogeniphilus]